MRSRLKANGADTLNTPTSPNSSPLAGKLFDDANQRLTPTHANKKGRRYRYYVSQSLITGTSPENEDGWRIPAEAIESAVFNGVAQLLNDRHELATVVREAGIAIDRLPGILSTAARLHRDYAASETRKHIINAIDRVAIHETQISISLKASLLLPSVEPELTLLHHLPITIKRRGQEMRIVIEGPRDKTPDQDQGLMTAIRRARAWFEDLAVANKSLAQIAEEAGVSKGYVSRMMPIAFLAPSLSRRSSPEQYCPDLRLISSPIIPIFPSPGTSR